MFGGLPPLHVAGFWPMQCEFPLPGLLTAIRCAGAPVRPRLLQRVRAPERARPFRVPCAPLVVGLQVAIGLGLLASFVMAKPRALAIDAGLLVVGLGAYRWFRARG